MRLHLYLFLCSFVVLFIFGCSKDAVEDPSANEPGPPEETVLEGDSDAAVLPSEADAPDDTPVVESTDEVGGNADVQTDVEVEKNDNAGEAAEPKEDISNESASNGPAMTPTDDSNGLVESGNGDGNGNDGETPDNAPSDDAGYGEPSAPLSPLAAGMDLSNMAGNLRLFLTDAPAAFDAVWVTVSRIEIHAEADAEEHWIPLVEDLGEIDLLSLQNSVTAVLGDAALAPGSYRQLRLIVENARVETNGASEELVIPSGAKSGIKINLNLNVEKGVQYVVALDFDALESIRKKGKGYMMQPVIRVVHTGHLDHDGVVITDEEAAAEDDAEAEQTEEPALEEPVNPANGTDTDSPPAEDAVDGTDSTEDEDAPDTADTTDEAPVEPVEEVAA